MKRFITYRVNGNTYTKYFDTITEAKRCYETYISLGIEILDYYLWEDQHE